MLLYTLLETELSSEQCFFVRSLNSTSGSQNIGEKQKDMYNQTKMTDLLELYFSPGMLSSKGQVLYKHHKLPDKRECAHI